MNVLTGGSATLRHRVVPGDPVVRTRCGDTYPPSPREHPVAGPELLRPMAKPEPW
jgi:hypothetical protein